MIINVVQFMPLIFCWYIWSTR